MVTGDVTPIEIIADLRAQLATAESRLADAVQRVRDLEGRGAPHWTHYKAKLEVSEANLARAAAMLEEWGCLSCRATYATTLMGRTRALLAELRKP
jgi:hypothetical protein